MKRMLLAIVCSAGLVGAPGGALADPAFDQDMASRYLRAAQSGDDEAQFYLGALYSAGVGVPRSDQEAYRWISRAASQGHSHAMLILAGLYATGRGVARNNVEAYKWAYIVNGASKVDEFRDGSSQLMSVLEKRMNSDEIYTAKSEAGKWRATVTSRPAPTAPPPPAAASTPTPAPTPTVAIGASTPAPTSASPTPQPSSKPANSDNPMDAFSKNFSKDDVDDFLREMPRLRKKYGF